MSQVVRAAARHGRPRKQTCQVTGKKRYPDKSAAIGFLHLAVTRQRLAKCEGYESSHREQRAYSCSGCQGWHLTSWTAYQYVNTIGGVS